MLTLLMLEKHFTVLSSPMVNYLERDGRRVKWLMHRGTMYLYSLDEKASSAIPLSHGDEGIDQINKAFEELAS